MRKLVQMGLVSFSATLFALSLGGQPRRPTRPVRGRPAAAAEPATPSSPRIAVDLGELRWGMTRAEVVTFFRQSIRASYLPRMKNLGAIEQFRMNEQRDAEIRRLEQSWVPFDGRPEHRQWDTSFISDEFTHNNAEGMLVSEDARGNREFLFFINDHLWKRVQARNANGRRINLASVVPQLEGIYGPSRRVTEDGALHHLEWHDDHSRLRVFDQTTFYGVLCLAYEDNATLAQLSTLRQNVPTKNRTARAQLDLSQSEGGSTTGDPNADIADRITGQLRRVQNADAGTAAGRPGTAAARPSGAGTAPSAPSGGSQGTVDDPLAGLGL
ncbi:MAG: hypothetical protein HY909_14585 [Deltaproteobacteria bacterium]|nr:hypothetical protein [Deltaproteobacteria bacterium]